MSGIVKSKGGWLLWTLESLSDINDAVEVYEATQSENAMLEVAREVAELIGIGIPLWYLDKFLVKTKLDRVFDVFKTNPSFEAYLRNQALTKGARDIGVGALAEWGLHELAEWVSEKQLLDPHFALIDLFYRTAARTQSRRDPLIFDLDDDGLETVSAAQSGVFFDHDGRIEWGQAWYIA